MTSRLPKQHTLHCLSCTCELTKVSQCDRNIARWVDVDHSNSWYVDTISLATWRFPRKHYQTVWGCDTLVHRDWLKASTWQSSPGMSKRLSQTKILPHTMQYREPVNLVDWIMEYKCIFLPASWLPRDEIRSTEPELVQHRKRPLFVASTR